MNTYIILSVWYTEQDGCETKTKAWRQVFHTYIYSKVSFFSYFIESLRISCAVLFNWCSSRNTLAYISVASFAVVDGEVIFNFSLCVWVE
jgi:hypothetical protein